jgi:uncharacterized protein (TIGR02246 family)
MLNDEQAIRDVVAKWNEASEAGDIETIAGFIADDAVFQVPGRAPFGKDEFVTSFQAGMEQVRIAVNCEIEELQVAGDFAYLRNRLRVMITPRGGGVPMTRAGYTLTILRKRPDGSWVLSRDANLLVPETPGRTAI